MVTPMFGRVVGWLIIATILGFCALIIFGVFS